MLQVVNHRVVKNLGTLKELQEQLGRKREVLIRWRLFCQKLYTTVGVGTNTAVF